MNLTAYYGEGDIGFVSALSLDDKGYVYVSTSYQGNKDVYVEIVDDSNRSTAMTLTADEAEAFALMLLTCIENKVSRVNL